MIESNKRKCKICEKMVDRIMAGKFPSNNKKWVDKDGKQWMGNVCPSCNRDRASKTMIKLRNGENEID
jgi:hypothetical protein